MKYRVMLAGGKGFWIFLEDGGPPNAPLTALLDDSPPFRKFAGRLLSDIGPGRDPHRAAELARDWFYGGGDSAHEIVSVELTRIRPPAGQTGIPVEDHVDYGEILGRRFASAALVLEFRTENVGTGPVTLRTAEVDAIRGDTPASEAWKAPIVRIEALAPVGEECMASRDRIETIIADLLPRLEAWWETARDDEDWTRREDGFRAWFGDLLWTDGRSRRELRGVTAEDYTIACNGPLVAGDLIRWTEHVFDEDEGERPLGPRTVEGEVRECRIAAEIDDDELAIRVDEAEGVEPPEPGRMLTRRYRDLREIELFRADVDETARDTLVTHGEAVRQTAREAGADS